MSQMKRAASSGSGSRSCGGRGATSPSPSCPWMCTGKCRGSRTSGRAAPRATGTSMPKRWHSASALAVVTSTGALPNTVLMPTSSARASRASISSAIASSMPGSVSNRMRVRGGMGQGRSGSATPMAMNTPPQAWLKRRPTR